MSYGTKIYMRQGGAEQVVESGGKIVIKSGGAITASGGSKAAAIANFTSSADVSAAQVAKLNAMLGALRAVGILATS